MSIRAVIMAGGKGTRIAEINSEVPKPMIRVCGKPILEHQIDCLKSQGVVDITLIVGHLGQVIKDYFGNGTSFGVNIDYITETEPLGTAGALWFLKGVINDDFLFINGDLIFDVDVARLYNFHKSKNVTITLFTHPNNHPYDSGIIVSDENDIVTKWLHKEDKRTWYKNQTNAGLHMLSSKVFELFKVYDKPVKLDFDRDIVTKLIDSREIAVYNSPEYVKDMGTPERYKQVESDIENGIVKAKNLLNKQTALFLDRDGTINKYVGFLTNIDDFELNDGIVELIRNANKNGQLVIVITNQPVIARGDVTWEQLTEIHNKMETLLGEKGAYVNDIFVCPHHPDKGFEGERVEYKIDCDCRKPKAGLFFKAAEKYNIDLGRSLMIGDSESDLEAAELAGCEGKLWNRVV